MVNKSTAIIAVVVVLLLGWFVLNSNNSQELGQEINVPVAIQSVEGNHILITNTGREVFPKPLFRFNEEIVTAEGNGTIQPNSTVTYVVNLPAYQVQNSRVSIQGSTPDNQASATVLITTPTTLERGSGTTTQQGTPNGNSTPVPPVSPPAPSVPPSTPPVTPPVASSEFVQANGTHLTLNGASYKFVGVNIYGLASDDDYNCGGNPDDPEEYVESVFTVLEQKHVNAVRFWAFQSFSHDNFVAINRVIAAAKRHNIKLIPTLENHWTHCTEGGEKTASWYANPSGNYGYTLSFENYVRQIVTRYKNEPTILMWQLMNEAESEDATVLLNFARRMSNTIREIDGNHLISFGTLGTGQAGTNDQNYINLHSLPNVNVVEAHDYSRPNEPLPGYPWNGNVNRLDSIAADLATSQQLNKPFFIGEAGISSQANRVELFRAKMNAAFSNNTRGYLIWNFEMEQCSGYCFYPGDPLMEIFQEYN
ncbi:MAG: cellulase family glycosylhydrolase [Candidatus Micrarchaeota archaeon]